jgi:MoaA/NifB/PqqE/SkfB family radical SAM enzyme
MEMDCPKSMKKLIDEMQGKLIYYCVRFSGTNLHFDPHRITLCHDAELENPPTDVRDFCATESFSAEMFYEKIYDILVKAQDPEYPCRSCSQCKEEVYEFKPISSVVVGTSKRCNSNCIYCQSRTKQEKSYDATLYINELHEAGLLREKCFFDWGGGEPTLNATYEKTVRFLAERGYRQRFNTNAIIFSPQTYRALKDGNGFATVSVDSGTRECFRRVKGHDGYEQVWENIAKYREASEEVRVKYIVFNLNSDLAELDAFLDRCQKAHIKDILIDAEVHSYQPSKQAGPFYFRQKEVEAVLYLKEQALSRGFNSMDGGFSFSQGRRGGVTEQLPQTFCDNIDYEIISNGVYVQTFAIAEHLFERILEEPQLPVYILGGGNGGRLVYQALKTAGLSSQIVDCAPAGTAWGGQPFPLPPAHIILHQACWKEQLKIINDCHLGIDGYVYYFPYWMFQVYLESKMYEGFDRMEKTVIFYGAGNDAKNNKAIFEEFKPVCFVDRDSTKYAETFMGKKVLPLEQALQEYPEALFYITTSKYKREILAELLDYVEAGRIINNETALPTATNLGNALLSVLEPAKNGGGGGGRVEHRQR